MLLRVTIQFVALLACIVSGNQRFIFGRGVFDLYGGYELCLNSRYTSVVVVNFGFEGVSIEFCLKFSVFRFLSMVVASFEHFENGCSNSRFSAILFLSN